MCDCRTKPPLGVIPWPIWLESRRDELIYAIERYSEAGRPALPAWTKELRWIDNQLKANPFNLKRFANS